MGLDMGHRNIGIALSDAEERLAYGHGTLRRAKLAGDLAAIAHLVVQEGVDGIVVGLPRSLDGSLGQQAERVRRFAEALAARVAVPVAYWDERLTTVAAERAMREAGVSARARREHIDEEAAVLILEGFLSHRRHEAGRGKVE